MKLAMNEEQARGLLLGLGATQLVWSTVADDDPDGDGFALDSVHLEDAQGETVAWYAQECEDRAYGLAEAHSLEDEPASYSLDLATGATCSLVLGHRDDDDPRYFQVDEHGHVL